MEFVTDISLSLIQMVEPFILSKFFTISAVVVIVLVYFYGPSWGVRGVPGPPTMPIVGHLPLLAKYGPDVFSVLAKRYGPIYRFRFLNYLNHFLHLHTTDRKSHTAGFSLSTFFRAVFI